jgi:hypothetical protein
MSKFVQFRTSLSLGTAIPCPSSLISQKIRPSSQWSVGILRYSWPHFRNRLLISRRITRRSATAAGLALVAPAFLSLFNPHPTRVVTIPPAVSKSIGFLTLIPLADSLSVALCGFGGKHLMLMGAPLHHFVIVLPPREVLTVFSVTTCIALQNG